VIVVGAVESAELAALAPQLPQPGREAAVEEKDKGNGVNGELPEDIQRWTAKRRAALVLSIVKGETTAVEAARKHDLTVAEIESWKGTFLLAAENALRSRPKDEEALHQEQVKKLERKVGQLVMELDIAREALKLHPFPETTSDE
jgi:transposase-like protein